MDAERIGPKAIDASRDEAPGLRYAAGEMRNTPARRETTHTNTAVDRQEGAGEARVRPVRSHGEACLPRNRSKIERRRAAENQLELELEGLDGCIGFRLQLISGARKPDVDTVLCHRWNAEAWRKW